MPARKVKALSRTLEMLKVIPVAPKFCTTKDIHKQLLAHDPDVTIRTVQRDLMELTEVMGLTFGDSPDGYKWSFAFDSPNQFIPAITKEEALSLKLVQEHLKLFLPSHVFERLTALFKKSDDILSQTPNSKDWSDLVRPMPQALQFKPVDISQEYIDTIYDALINKNWVKLKYANKKKIYDVKPLGVIIRDAKLVLVCQYQGFDNVRNLLVHRIKSVEITTETFTSDFSLQKYIKKQAASVLLNQDKINLQFEAKDYIKNLLSESALDDSQVLTTISDEWVNVKMMVQHTVELENWLLSQLHDIKIIGPIKLKERVLKKAELGLVINRP